LSSFYFFFFGPARASSLVTDSVSFLSTQGGDIAAR
jgi:hypothetical protein